MAETAQLVGGPADGKTMAIPELWQYINIAIPPQMTWITEDVEALRDEPVPFRTGVYRLELGTFGAPRRNDHGELSYFWQGER